MTVAVTGATGFIGRHVVAELARRGLPTVLVCRPDTPVPAALSMHPVVRWDIHEPAENGFARIGKPAALIHLAWSGLPHYMSAHHVENELPAQYRFLEGLVESGLTCCVAAGTCLEYGMQSGELSEQDAPQPTTPYGVAKDALRQQLEVLAGHRGVALTWARLFYTFGDGQSAASLYPQLRAAAERGDTGFDMSGGEQVRDYLPVAEVARLIVALALRGSCAGVVNVCSGQPVTVRSLVERWMAENGWRLTLNLGRYPYPEYEPMAFWGSREKLDTLVGSGAP